jgi:TRAP-type C4-dicarboxylate transport system substrate-binding protein
MEQWYKNNGFNPVAAEATNIATGLGTGMIQATPMPPYGAVALQISRSAKYMLDINVDPLIGALVVTDGAWARIEPGDRDKVTEAAKAMETRLQTEVPKQDANAVVTMQTRGLTVTRLAPTEAAAFHAEADRLVGTMRGAMVPPEIYDMAVQARDEYRKTHGK